MSDIAIRVENLSKRHRIGAREERLNTLRARLARLAASPFDYLRQQIRGPSEEEIIWALKDVSFEVGRGEVVGIIGRNGAGKSTLLKILSRVTDPTAGRAEVYGRVGSLLEVGTGFHPELTGRENAYLNGAILGMTKAEIDRRFDEIVDFSGVEKFIDTPVKRYSSGMHVRLAFSVAAHLEPEILMVDEVLAVGDVAFQKKCIGKMGEVSCAGRTVLFVSHNMAAVRKLCAKAILLQDGSIIHMGDTDTTIGMYLRENQTAPSPSVELPAGDEEAPGCATHLRYFTASGDPRAEFRLREPWKIKLEFEIFEATEHVVAAVGIVTHGSVPLLTYWSQPADLQPGRYQVEFDCTVPLKATELQFAVGLSSYGRTFYYQEGIGCVSISEVAVGAQPYRARGAGLLLTVQDRTIQPLPSPSHRITV